MMGGVNNAEDYIRTMGLGYTEDRNGIPTPVITDPLLQGGIVSVYYLGCLVGAIGGGIVGERIGRIRTIALAVVLAIIGASLQTSAMNHVWMICARLVNGFGTGKSTHRTRTLTSGMLNSIIPVWATETAEHTSRGQFIAIEFTLNIFGVVVAYWME
jgi:MFS family permease